MQNVSDLMIRKFPNQVIILSIIFVLMWTPIMVTCLNLTQDSFIVVICIRRYFFYPRKKLQEQDEKVTALNHMKIEYDQLKFESQVHLKDLRNYIEKYTGLERKVGLIWETYLFPVLQARFF